jgi:hypothetical protein
MAKPATKNRSRPIAVCILCASPLLPDTKPEHVWLRSLGGRKTTRQALCNTCNNDMGNGPDKALAESVSYIRNILHLRSGEGKPPPTLKGLRNGDDRVALKPGGIPIIDGGPPFVITQLPDGNSSVRLRVASAEQLRRILPDLAKALRMSLAEVKELLRTAQVSDVSQRIEEQHHHISLGGPEAMRSMLKTCLTLWADRHGAIELQKQIYDDARRFVRNGGEFKHSQIDFGQPFNSDMLVSRFGQYFNLALVASDHVGRVIGYFRLYNSCAWRFELCSTGAPPNSIITYASNPEQPSIWKIETTDALIPAVAVLETSPSQNYEDVCRAFVGMFRDHQRKATDAEIHRILDHAIEKLGLSSDEPLTQEQAHLFLEKVSSQAESWILGTPFEEPRTAEEIARLLDDTD